jgi:hypothetical protein
MRRQTGTLIRQKRRMLRDESIRFAASDPTYWALLSCAPQYQVDIRVSTMF